MEPLGYEPIPKILFSKPIYGKPVNRNPTTIKSMHLARLSPTIVDSGAFHILRIPLYMKRRGMTSKHGLSTKLHNP